MEQEKVTGKLFSHSPFTVSLTARCSQQVRGSAVKFKGIS